MGYEVRLSLSADADHLCSLLTESPHEVFEKPFFGYITFLLTGKEQDLLKSLASEIGEFNTLSKDVFAFALVTQECEIPVEVRHPKGAVPPTASAPQPRQVVDLTAIKLGRLQDYSHLFTESNRGALLALSTATNEVAKWFGVTAEIPCMLVFDAVPSSPIAVPLNAVTVETLIETFRRVVGRFSGPDYRRHIGAIRRIGELADLQAPVDGPSIDVLRTVFLRERDSQDRALSLLSERLCDGSSAGNARNALLDLHLPSGSLTAARYAIDRSDAHRRKLSKAQGVAKQCAASIGTDAELQLMPKRVFRRSIAPLLPPETAVCIPSSSVEWEALGAMLASLLKAEAQNVLGPLIAEVRIAPEEFERRVDHAHAAAKENWAAELRDFERLYAERSGLVEAFLAARMPSFSAVVDEEVRRAGLKVSMGQAVSGVSSWFTKSGVARGAGKLVLQVARKAVGL